MPKFINKNLAEQPGSMIGLRRARAGGEKAFRPGMVKVV